MASRLRSFGLLGGSARYLNLSSNSKNVRYELQSNASRHTIGSTTSETPLYQSSDDVTLLGKPSRKRIFHSTDIAVALIALACMTLSIFVVSNNRVSWYLGTGNRQLIVIGFLLSIMSLCLASVTPTLFILLEARFGNSTLQNYDGILRNKPLASKLSFAWRAVLVTMLALPVGLSVAYKTFTGGESSMNIRTTNYISNTTWYGLFSPPGIVSITGLSSTLNATASFRNATQAIQRPGNSTEPDLPKFRKPQPYGYNILLLNESSAAALDTLHSDYILEIQKLLAPGESWTITAPVLGTVATLNESAASNRRKFEEDFIYACEDKSRGGNLWWHKKEDMFNDFSISLTDQFDVSDQSLQYIDISPGSGGCVDRAPYEHLFNIYRQQCSGTWSISRGGFQLLGGSCNDTILPWDKQQIIQWQYMGLPAWYMGFLMEMLKTFSGNSHYEYRGNQSHWRMPYMSVSVATMLWSRITQLQSLSAPVDSEAFNKSSQAINVTNDIFKVILSHEEASIFYQVNATDQTIIYIRPTLQKSPWLYLVLGVQPILLCIVLGIIALLHTVPLDKGFGLISILSGIERRGLDSLSGASLSGELKRPVKLTMSPVAPVQGDEKHTIKYLIDSSSEEMQGNKSLSRNIEYH